ncbi:hypothetical protein BAUCODRAFT_239343 [Baudoinia panamericana UAMH 10762]|uniref:Uncharacterized protein n=1 Tax=Baudoinia panamericana (strain UAMH 10762) TaxID=717646 RepID=M2MPM4_BAUPA|nr:uncharacterized protein BAUCODRAFT_239343 [Baudoinia panamericana UAMH 10762]EMC93398.1 hypothetical protein BAUCODRAFT_239343 [Baudoinia panamericana UAMH 10762]
MRANNLVRDETGLSKPCGYHRARLCFVSNRRISCPGRVILHSTGRSDLQSLLAYVTRCDKQGAPAWVGKAEAAMHSSVICFCDGPTPPPALPDAHMTEIQDAPIDSLHTTFLWRAHPCLVS